MNWTRREWLAVVVMIVSLIGTWVFIDSTAMFRLGAIGIAIVGLLNIYKGYKAYKNPQALNENWPATEDKAWGKFAMKAGLVLLALAALLAFYVPKLF